MIRSKKFPLAFIVRSFVFSVLLTGLVRGLGLLESWGFSVFLLSHCVIIAFSYFQLSPQTTASEQNQAARKENDILGLSPSTAHNPESLSNAFFVSPTAKFLLDLLTRLFENWPEAVLIINTQQKIIYSNAEVNKSFGYTGSLVGVELAGLIRHPDLLNGINQINQQQCEFLNLEFSLTIPVTRHWNITLQQLSLPLAEILATIIVLRDQTFAKKMIQKNQDFVANASHQLQTPLAVISSLTETLQDHFPEDLQKRELFLSLFQQQVRRMGQLVKDLLLLSKIEQLESSYPKNIISLASILETVQGDLQPLLNKYSIDLQLGGEYISFDFIPPGGKFLEKTDDLPALSGDSQQLYILFENLLDNAVRYSMPGNKIWLVFRYRQLDAAGKELEILVVDSGIGIAEEDLARITERFYRAANNPNTQGTGLGLAIASHIIQRHRGRLKIYSRPQQGSCFVVSLPIPNESAA